MKKLFFVLLLATCYFIAYSQEKGTFRDPRDSKDYTWMKFGTQVWMTQNLAYVRNIVTEASDRNQWVNLGNSGKFTGWCSYDNKEENLTKYGALYQWEAAKKACPTGWHLPSNDEWRQLFMYYGTTKEEMTAKEMFGQPVECFGQKVQLNSKLKDKDGFNAMSKGGFRGHNVFFASINIHATYWSATEDNWGGRVGAKDVSIFSDERTYIKNSSAEKAVGYSVRCVKD